jgi:hypothetical protein
MRSGPAGGSGGQPVASAPEKTTKRPPAGKKRSPAGWGCFSRSGRNSSPALPSQGLCSFCPKLGVVGRDWWDGTGGTGLVGRDWWDGTGGTGLVGRDWRDGTGGTGLAGRDWRDGTGGTGLADGDWRDRDWWDGTGGTGLVGRDAPARDAVDCFLNCSPVPLRSGFLRRRRISGRDSKLEVGQSSQLQGFQTLTRD